MNLSFNPIYSVENNKDTCTIVKGILNYTNLYIVIINKNDNHITYFRGIANKYNKAEQETTLYNLYSSEYINEITSRYDFETYTDVGNDTPTK